MVRKKYTIEDMQRMAKERDGVCLSDKYKNPNIPLRWKCNICNNVWVANPSNIIYRNQWCSYCRMKYFGESNFRNILEYRTGLKWPKKRPKWMNDGKPGPRELDMYNEKLKVAIEYNDHKIKLRQQTEESFKRQKEYDIIREQRCKDNGVKLIWVPLMKIEDMDDYIKKICRENNIKIVNNDKLDYKKLFNYSRLREDFDKIKKIIKENDGVCLSEFYQGKYKKIKIRCNKDGNIWQTIPRLILNGSWCPKCHYKKVSIIKKLCINDAKYLAKQKGGKCVSKKYIHSRQLLEWECEKGHRWKASYNNVLKQTWCPKCIKKRNDDLKRLSLDDAQKLAAKQNGQCLSKKYINNRTKMKWMCSNEHIWKTKYSHIKQGSWCPICYKQKRGEKNEV